ncbi:unnamed protein product, partial [Amoebophrya sp. A25]
TDAVVIVNLGAALSAGLRFFVSQNGVVLTPGNNNGLLSTSFFARIVDRMTGEEIFTASGEVD